MTSRNDAADESRSASRRFHISPDFVILALSTIVVALWVCDRTHWRTILGGKGMPVLIALTLVTSTLVVMLLWLADSLVYRRKFQFTIRSLLLVTLCTALLCSWFAVDLRAAKRQQDAVARLSEYLWCACFVERPIEQLPWPAYWTRGLLGDHFFLSVHRAVLGGTDVTDAAIAELERLPDLEKVTIECDQISDACMEHLAGLRRLRSLSITAAPITDKGVARLSELTALRTLHLNYLKLTDASLDSLRSLTSLDELFLSGMEFSDAKIASLREALPNCEVVVAIP
jgi:hypothetical protein